MSDLNLKLPIIRGHLPEKRVLSMDDYLKFVQFNLKHTVDRKAAAKWKKLRAVDVAFRID
ncbi:MAG: hypothetical protein Q8O13_03180 [Candidatus Omnitrophota bacterium]|nr:hypothetical protein [Candidatus Omnitrophota bacterium]